MERFSAFVLRRRRLVALLALVGFFAGLGATPLAVQRLSEDYTVFEVNKEITGIYGNGGYQRPFIPVVVLPEGSSPEAVGAAFAAVAARLPEARVVSYADTHDPRLVGSDGRTTFGLVFPGTYSDGSPPGGGLGETPDDGPLISETMRPHLPPGSVVHVTGLDRLVPSADAGGVNVPSKILVGLLATVVVLLLVFRSALAFVPVLVSVLAVFLSFLVILLLTLVMTVHDVALTTMPLLGLGIAVDYSLLLVARWREERARGFAGDEAVHRAMAAAGRSILFSGVAVAIGLLTMIVLPVPFLRSLGLAGMIIAAVSVVTTLTVLPVLLARSRSRVSRREPRAWAVWARWVVRRRIPAAVLTGGLLLALAWAGLGVDLGLPESRDLRGPGTPGVAALERAGIPTGVITPIEVLVTGQPKPESLAKVAGVHAVLAPDTPKWRRDGTAILSVLPVAENGSAEGEATVARLGAAVPEGTQVGGNVAQSMDFRDRAYGAFPWMLGLIALVTFVLLARAFRSLLLPIKAIVLNLLSLGAVIGAMVLIWQSGGMSIGEFVPLTIFAFLYGLSMDYEVFILARMREEYDRSGDSRRAVVEGVSRTGRLVTSAALILIVSFAALAMTPEMDVRIFAGGLALGILIDATLIRGVLLPALVAMMGRWNWWLPGWAATLLRVPPSPLVSP
ncbi:MMPL family transporter [Nonomuraea sp. NPDC050310]|uniref:MMPL family transporter n=1 Tax=Nonomuraea sp. NPDC050310 TaxID=3154935 RepID=UPI0033F87375